MSFPMRSKKAAFRYSLEIRKLIRISFSSQRDTAWGASVLIRTICPCDRVISVLFTYKEQEPE